MKKNTLKNTLKNLLVVICCLASSFWSEIKSMEEDKEFDRNLYNLHCIGHYYRDCLNYGSKDEDKIRTLHGPSFEDSIKFLFIKRIQEEDFIKAYGIFQRLQDNLNNIQIVESIIKESYRNASENFAVFAHDYTKKSFETYLQTNQFSKALSLAKFYCSLSKRHKESDGWIDLIKKKVLEKAEDSWESIIPMLDSTAKKHDTELSIRESMINECMNAYSVFISEAITYKQLYDACSPMYPLYDVRQEKSKKNNIKDSILIKIYESRLMSNMGREEILSTGSVLNDPWVNSFISPSNLKFVIAKEFLPLIKDDMIITMEIYEKVNGRPHPRKKELVF